MEDKEKTKDISQIEGICDALGEGISIQDTDFMVLYQNKVHENMIGNHVGEYCYKAYEGKDDVCKGCPTAMAFKDGKVHKTERRVTIEITASPLRDSSGEIIAGIEIVRD
ncbi:MAG: PAS domain-containing sensor histidine kinase, partial [Planctomycetota bacterium]